MFEGLALALLQLLNWIPASAPFPIPEIHRSASHWFPLPRQIYSRIQLVMVVLVQQFFDINLENARNKYTKNTSTKITVFSFPFPNLSDVCNPFHFSLTSCKIFRTWKKNIEKRYCHHPSHQPSPSYQPSTVTLGFPSNHRSKIIRSKPVIFPFSADLRWWQLSRWYFKNKNGNSPVFQWSLCCNRKSCI